MGNFEIFGLQFAGSLLVYALIARWYVAPRLATMPLSAALQPLLLHHATRILGMTLLVSAVVGPGVPRAFADQVAYGDLIAAVRALVSIAARRAPASYAIPPGSTFRLEGV